GIHSCSDEPNTRDAGWRRRQEEHPDGAEDTCARADTPAAGGLRDPRSERVRGGLPVRRRRGGAAARRGAPTSGDPCLGAHGGGTQSPAATSPWDEGGHRKLYGLRVRVTRNGPTPQRSIRVNRVLLGLALASYVVFAGKAIGQNFGSFAD